MSATTTTNTTSIPILCDLSALSEDQRDRVTALARRMLPRADQLKVLPDGYALGFSDASAEQLADLAELIALDRRCCAFLRHGLVCDPGPGITWLELTGGPGAKDAITDEILQLVSTAVAAAAGVVSGEPDGSSPK